MPMKGLPPRHRTFVSEYLKTKNAKQSAIKAGFSKKTAESQASRLLRNVKVKAEIDKALSKVEEKALITVAEVVSELKKIGFADLRRAYGPDNKILPLSQIPDDVAAALVGVESEELYEGTGQDRERVGDTVKVKLADKVRCLEALGKHLGIFIERRELSGPNGGPIRLEDLVAGSFEEEEKD
jgi:phage terminase small subunit